MTPPLLLCDEAPPEYKHQAPGEELDQGSEGEAGQHQGKHGLGQTQLLGPEEKTRETEHLQKSLLTFLQRVQDFILFYLARYAFFHHTLKLTMAMMTQVAVTQSQGNRWEEICFREPTMSRVLTSIWGKNLSLNFG